MPDRIHPFRHTVMVGNAHPTKNTVPPNIDVTKNILFCFFRVFCVITSRYHALHPPGRTVVRSKCSRHFSRGLIFLFQVFADYGTGIGSFNDMELLNDNELLFVGLPGVVNDGRLLNPLTGQFIRDINIGIGISMTDMEADLRAQTVPAPAAVWLFGSGLIGLIGFARRKRA